MVDSIFCSHVMDVTVGMPRSAGICCGDSMWIPLGTVESDWFGDVTSAFPRITSPFLYSRITTASVNSFGSHDRWWM